PPPTPVPLMLETSRRRLQAWLTAVMLFLAASTPARADELEAFPAAVHLEGKDARQQVLVSAKRSDGKLHDVTRAASYRSIDPGVAIVSAAGIVQPVGSGKTQIEVSAGQAKLMIPVTIVH